MAWQRVSKSDSAWTFRRLRLEPLEKRRMLAVFTVSNLDDGPVTVAGDLPGSLRQAIFDANATGGSDEIQFQDGLTGTITLTAGQIIISESLDLNGPGRYAVTVSGNNSTRIFDVTDGNSNVNQVVTIRDLTLADGDTSQLGFSEDGGAVRSRENLVLADVTILNSYAEGDGGGIWVSPAAVNGAVAIHNSLITGNRANENGGGAFVSTGSTDTVTITESTFSYNQGSIGLSGPGGGGLHLRVNGPTVVRDSTISGNSAVGDNGGGINLEPSSNADITLTGVTVSGNSSRRGAGINVFGPTTGGVPVKILHSTITGNRVLGSSAYGGGLRLFITKIELDHTIVAGNQAASGPDIYRGSSSTITSRHSLIGDKSGSPLVEAPVGSPDVNGNLIGDPGGSGVIDAGLAPLADAGGPTKVHALLPLSPALDAGDAGIASPPMFDQRGAPFLRIVDGDLTTGGRIDIGAYEFQGISVDSTLVVDSLLDLFDGDYSSGNLSLREAIGLANADLDSPQTITFAPSLDGQMLVQSFGTLTSTDALTIQGLGRDTFTVAGLGHSAVFRFDDGDPTVHREVTVEDLSITGGAANNFESQDEVAGGLTSTEHTILLRLNVHHNQSTGQAGGVIAIADGVDNLLADSIVANNSGSQLGGAAVLARNGGSTTVRGTIFRENTSPVGGGGLGIVAESAGTGLATHNVFEANQGAGVGGGVIAAAVGGELILEQSRLIGNTGDAGGGGYFFATANGNIIARRLEVTGNDVPSSQPSFFRSGGGLHLDAGTNSNILLEDSLVAGNSTNGPGGGLNIVSSPGQVILNQVTVHDNLSYGNGGGLHSLATNGGSTLVQHSTIANNRAISPSSTNAEGGGVFVKSGLLSLDHTIVATNTDELGSPDAAIDEVGFANTPGLLDAHYSLIGENSGSGLTPAPVGSPDAQGNLIGGAGPAVIDAMLGALADNGGNTQTLLLQPGSPAIDAGDPDVANSPEYDQRGFAFERIVGSKIDIGATESGATSADFDADGDVDGTDFLTWQRGFGKPAAVHSEGDADLDSTVGTADLSLWSDTYGQTESMSIDLIAAPLGSMEEDPEPTTFSQSLIAQPVFLSLPARDSFRTKVQDPAIVAASEGARFSWSAEQSYQAVSRAWRDDFAGPLTEFDNPSDGLADTAATTGEFSEFAEDAVNQAILELYGELENGH